MISSTIIASNLFITMQGSTVLHDISFALKPNEHLAVIGASGSGKTTLAKVLAGQLFAKGKIEILYNEDSDLSKKIVLTEQRYNFKNSSNISDFYYQQRFNSFDAEDALTVLQELHRFTNNSSEYKINKLLAQLNLQHRKEAPLIQLSSGEHKRFQLIKALLQPPQILILDSPFTGLDKAARKQLLEIINTTAANGTQIIIITDAQQIPACITHIACLEKGKLKDFTSKELFDFNKIKIFQTNQYFDIDELPVTQQEHNFEYAVQMKNTTVKYGSKSILHNINWQVKRGDKWLVKGHNGAGKSTLLSLINGDNPQAYKNQIYLFDKRRGSGESIWDIKQKIGFVSPELHAFYDKSTSCCNAVASGFWDTIGLFKKLSPTQQNIVQEWLHFFQLTAVQHKPFSSLSFSMQRLVLLARALVKNPPLLILDEPCQGLDDEQKNSFVQLVNDLCEELNKTLIYVSHYDNEIPDCINHVLELKHGEQIISSIKIKMFYQYKVNYMNTTIFEKIKLLPPEKQQEFENYAEYLLQKHEQQLPTDTESLAERRSRLAGRLKGQIWMAEDFNETPEDFKDYI